MANVAEQIRTPPAPATPTPAAPVGNRVLLYSVSWEEYTKFLEAAGTHRLRLTYDRGTLELMTLSNPHEWWRGRFGFVIRLLGGVLNIDVQGCGSTTLRREDLERGLEPDEGFYIANEWMRGPRHLDLAHDSPPDLAVEIDISRSCLDRMNIYAALGVREVWRFAGETLQVYRRNDAGQYEVHDRSTCFPNLPLVELVQFLQETQGLSESGLILPFQTWVREHVLANPPGSGT
jgi:Uma2 family endonuclease